MSKTQTTLIETFRARQKEAVRDGHIAVNHVRGEIMRVTHSDRDFLEVCRVIEEAGKAMVDDWGQRCDDAREGSWSRKEVTAQALNLIEDYIRQAKTWRVIPPAFPGQKQNDLMRAECDAVGVRLGQRFNDQLNRIALKPKKRWHERNPVRWAILLIIIGGLIAYVNFAVQTATKPAFEPPRAETQP